MFSGNMLAAVKPTSDDSFPSAYFYSQPGATGPGYFDNLAPQVCSVQGVEGAGCVGCGVKGAEPRIH